MAGEDFVIDFYAALAVPRDATPEQIAAALASYQSQMELELNNPLTMKSARHALNVIVPGSRQALLAGPEARKRYDQRLAASERAQQQEKDTWAVGQALDERLRLPFFFDPYSGYDTEQPAYTLREIAARLDGEWQRARTWLADSSRRRHPLVLYLKHVALRSQLADTLEEQVIQHIKPGAETPMDINEAIEHCITLLNPELERPTVSISDTKFDSRTWTLNAGRFLPDQPAQSTLTLRHIGQRGCAFGRVVSLTNWLKVGDKHEQVRFALLPEGTNFAPGASTLNLPLTFDISMLQHNLLHRAELVIYVDNPDIPVETHLHVTLAVLALPPRVVFEPPATINSPFRMKATRQGNTATAQLLARNIGDEVLLPLAARLKSSYQEVSVKPETFHANEPITISVDTTDKESGTIYTIALNVDYSKTSGARGPEQLYVQGEVLPTVWQSLRREKSVGDRLIAGLAGGVLGFFALGLVGLAVAGHLLTLWSLLFPIILSAALLPAFTKIGIHMQRAGEGDSTAVPLSLPLLFGIPLVGGVVLDLICGLLPGQEPSFLCGAITGALLGLAVGFLIDKARHTKS